MPVKRKIGAAAPKANAKKAYGMCEELPSGEILRDFSSQQWSLGHAFATGGFGRIYTVTKVGDKATVYVAKIEPDSNGPIFQETHFYQRAAKRDKLEEWRQAKGLRFLGIPSFVAAGLHKIGDSGFRFLIMPQFGKDLESLRVSSEGGRLDEKLVFRIAKCCLDALEYLHVSAQYVHADIKAENLLAAEVKQTKSSSNDVRYYLVDFGLARKLSDAPVYKEAPKKAHDGTLIFTSLDAHKGCAPSYRGDVEILGYNLIYWLTGSLPWLKVQNTPAKVFDSKRYFSQNISEHIEQYLSGKAYREELVKYFDFVYLLDYPERPMYEFLHERMDNAIASCSKSTTPKFAIPASTPATTSKRKPAVSTSKKTLESKPAATVKTTPVAAKQLPKTATARVLLANFLNASSSDDSSFAGPSKSVRKDSSNHHNGKTAKDAVAEKSTPLRATRSNRPAVISPRRRSSIMIRKKYLISKPAARKKMPTLSSEESSFEPSDCSSMEDSERIVERSATRSSKAKRGRRAQVKR